MKKILSIVIVAMLVMSLAVALTSCDIINGITGGGAPELDGITLEGATYTYDGKEKSLAVSGELPEGVSVQYENNGKTDAGKYTVIAKFYYNDEYMEGADLSADLRINKASYASAMDGVSFPGATFTADGTAKSLAIVGTLPEGVSVSYSGNAKTEPGTYTVTASFTGDAVNYYPIDDMIAVMKIVEPQGGEDTPAVDLSGITFADATYTYDGAAKSLAIAGTLPEGVTVQYVNNGKTDAGSYIVSADFYLNGEKLEGLSKRASLKINRAVADLSGISFTGKTVMWDGTAKSLAIVGTLPDYATVKYVNNGQILAGTYTVYAKFTVTGNYETPDDMTATLTIIALDGALSEITFNDKTFEYDEAAHSIAISGTLPAGYTVEYVGNGAADIGTYTVTAKFYLNGQYIEGADKTATMTIESTEVDLSGITFVGATYTYDGTAKSIFIEGELPEGYSVQYVGNGEIKPGTYTVTAEFYYDGIHQEDADMKASYKINAASLPTIAVSGNTVDFDGKMHEITYNPGALPEGVSVIRIGEAQYKPGTYTFTFRYKLADDVAGCYDIGADVTATLTINDYTGDIVTEGLTFISVTGGYAVSGYEGDAVCVVIPSTYKDKAVVAVSSNAFKNNKAIKSIVVPDSVTAIGQGAFYGTELEEITLPFIGGSRNTSNKFIGHIFGALGYAANETFVPVTLKRVILSDTCTDIPAYSFFGCISLREIVIGDGVTEIGVSAFQGCTSLGSVYIPETVVSIPAAANYYNSPFFLCGDGFTVYLEAASAPAGFGAEWNSLTADAKVTVLYGKTYAEYLAAK